MRNYTDTKEYNKTLENLRKSMVPEKAIKEWSKTMSQFDENGMDIGTDYRGLVLAFSHPIK